MKPISKQESNFHSRDAIYDISGFANNKDYLPFIIQDGWLTELQANVIPIQVIKDVDLVKDKSTLVRVNVANAKDDSEQITVALFFNNTNIENKTQTVPSNNSTNFDFWHIPSVTGTNLEYRAEMSSANSSSTDEQSKFVDVVWTMCDAKMMQIIKGLSSYILFRICSNLRKRYPNGHFWTAGYFCDGIGNNDFEQTYSYIENQEMHHA